MQASTRSRIAWFLRLQRILTFPKYFLAPQAAKYRSPKLVRDEVTSVPSRDRGRMPDPAAAESLARHAGSGHLVLRPPNRSVTSSGSPIRRATSPAPAGTAVQRPVFQDVYRTAPDGRSLVAANSALAIMATSSKHDYLHAMWGSPPDPIGSSVQTTVRRHISFADTLPASRSIRSHQLEQSVAGRASISMRPENRVRTPPPPPPTAETRPEPSYALEPGPSSGGPKPDPGRNRQRQNIQGMSTVHLDGAALGQWTIQHLERTLAKPTAGMTGVDPRAGLPRGRVSPF
jgi:hypothetical protein